MIAYKESGLPRTATCPICSTEFERKPSQIAKYAASYCSRDCRAVGIRGPKPDLITGRRVPCEICEKLVWRTPATERDHVYCSPLCANRAPRTQRVERVVKLCGNCEEVMTMLPNDAARYQYCSSKCAAAVTSEARRGMPGKPWTDEARQKLSVTLRDKWQTEWVDRLEVASERMRGINNPRYRDGSARDLYAPGFTKRLKREIAKRDNYMCQLCGAPEGTPAHPVHHLDGTKHNHHPSNLILLCNSCHGKLHHWMDKVRF